MDNEEIEKLKKLIDLMESPEFQAQLDESITLIQAIQVIKNEIKNQSIKNDILKNAVQILTKNKLNFFLNN